MRHTAALLAVIALAGSLVAAPSCGRPSSSAGAWASHMGKLPFTVGYESGVAKAKLLKRPLMLFYTADW